MKLRNILLYITMLTFIATQLFANTNPVVENVVFSISGTTVTVTYDLSDVDASDTDFTVYMEVSDDNGTTWDFDYGLASGDIGPSVAKGTNKTISWTYDGAENSNFKMKVLADDLFGDQIYYPRKIYNTVTIGTQTWLKENLDVGTMIIHGEDTEADNGIIEKYCYDNDKANCDTYGGLYGWNEAMKYVTTEGAQGICPSGWHIPTLVEQETLVTYVDNKATKLKANGSNTTGFSALYAGIRAATSGFHGLNDHTNIWSSTETVPGGEMVQHMDLYALSILRGIYFNDNFKQMGGTIRCLKD